MPRSTRESGKRAKRLKLKSCVNNLKFAVCYEIKREIVYLLLVKRVIIFPFVD